MQLRLLTGVPEFGDKVALRAVTCTNQSRRVLLQAFSLSTSYSQRFTYLSGFKKKKKIRVVPALIDNSLPYFKDMEDHGIDQMLNHAGFLIRIVQL